MKVLVTGANGLVGSHLIRQPNHEFYALTRHPPEVEEVHWLQADLAADFETSVFPKSLDAIVYLAQSNRYRDLPAGAADLINVNVAGVARLLQYALSLDPKPHIILASTGDVYGRSMGEPFSESDPLFQNVEPSLYPLSRKLAEEYASSFAAQYGLKLSIIRLFHIYGEEMPQTALVARLTDNVLHKRVIRLDGENGIIINPTYVADLSQMILRLIQDKPSQRNAIEIYNLAGQQSYTLRHIVETIGERLGISPQFEIAEARPAPYITPSTDKFIQHYGEFETTSFEEGFSKSDG
jgi:UDP-glucose 4-epimerase